MVKGSITNCASMTVGRKAFPHLLGACLLLTMSALLGACLTNEGEIDHLLAPRNAQIAKGHADTAQQAAASANEQTCDAAAPFRAHAELKAAEASGYSEQAQDLANEVQKSFEQAGLISDLRATVTEKMKGAYFDETTGTRSHRDNYQAALESFSNYFGYSYPAAGGGEAYSTGLRDSVNVAQVMQDAGNFVFHLARHAYDLENAATAIAEAPGLAELAQWAAPEQGIAGLVGELTAASDALHAAVSAGYSAELIVPGDPEDRSILVSQLDDPRAFQEAMGNILAAQHRVSALVRKLEEADAWLVSADSKIREFGWESAAKTAELSDLANEAAADATSNAWKAVEACGGEVPDEVRGYLADSYSPFGDQESPRIPDWNSTFWDISSP